MRSGLTGSDPRSVQCQTESCRRLRQPAGPASVSHSPRSDDALLRLQESLQTGRPDLKGRRQRGHMTVRGAALCQPAGGVGAGGHSVVLGQLLAAGGGRGRNGLQGFQGTHG